MRITVSMKVPWSLDLSGQRLPPLSGPRGLRGRAGLSRSRGLDEEPERVLERRACRSVIGAHAEDRRQDVGFPQRRGEIRAVARLAGHLEVHEAIQGNRAAVQALHRHPLLADVARHDFSELRVAARVLPDDLTRDAEAATLGRPLVAPRLIAALDES